MKKILLAIILLSGASQLKAQQLGTQLPYTFPKQADVYIKTQTAVKLDNPLIFKTGGTTTNQFLALKPKKVTVVKLNEQAFTSKMPVVKLDGRDNMPIAKLGGYDNMPIAFLNKASQDTLMTNEVQIVPVFKTPAELAPIKK